VCLLLLLPAGRVLLVLRKCVRLGLCVWLGEEAGPVNTTRYHDNREMTCQPRRNSQSHPSASQLGHFYSRSRVAVGFGGADLFLQGPDGAVPNLFFHAARRGTTACDAPYYDHTATTAEARTPAPNLRYLASLSDIDSPSWTLYNHPQSSLLLCAMVCAIPLRRELDALPLHHVLSSHLREA
jgi:hypothetical protein